MTRNKLIDCFNEFKSIPKNGYSFLSHGYLPESYVKQSVDVWKKLLPYKCIFAYKGDIKEEWIEELNELSKNCEIPMNVIPDLVIVNKVGFFEKIPTKEGKPRFAFMKFSDSFNNYGLPFGKLLYHLNTFSGEEYLLQPELKEYFNKDI